MHGISHQMQTWAWESDRTYTLLCCCLKVHVEVVEDFSRLSRASAEALPRFLAHSQKSPPSLPQAQISAQSTAGFTTNNQHRQNGSPSQQRQGHQRLRDPLLPHPTRLAQNHPGRSRRPDLQAREEGRHAESDRRRVEG